MPMKRLIVELVVMLILFALALLWASKIPEGTPGLFGKQPEEVYSIEYAETPIIEDVPYELFRDPPITIEVNVATPSSAIEEPKKKTKEPEMEYYGTMATTGYLATGCPCADGTYPSTGWTVACNDSRLWHRKIYIEGIGVRYVHDRGGMPMDVLDVFVGSLDEAYSITNYSRKVYIVE